MGVADPRKVAGSDALSVLVWGGAISKHADVWKNLCVGNFLRTSMFYRQPRVWWSLLATIYCPLPKGDNENTPSPPPRGVIVCGRSCLCPSADVTTTEYVRFVCSQVGAGGAAGERRQESA